MLVVGAVGLVAVPPAAAAPTSSDPALYAKLSAVMGDSRVQRAATSAVVLDSAGAELYGRYPDRSTTPASNTKIVTAVAAMHTLGPDYRFATRVMRRGRVTGGVLDGRLYLKGYGDPTTMESDYRALARRVRAAGIRVVDGTLAVDASYFDAQRYNPNWSTGYASQYYAAQVSALTVSPTRDYNSGTIVLTYRPGARGGKARVSVTPAAAARYVTLVNKTTTAGRSSTFRASRAWGTNTITVSGRVPAGRAPATRSITVNNPALYAGAVFRAELARAGVRVQGRTKALTTPASKRTVIAVDRSMSLSALLARL